MHLSSSIDSCVSNKNKDTTPVFAGTQSEVQITNYIGTTNKQSNNYIPTVASTEDITYATAIGKTCSVYKSLQHNSGAQGTKFSLPELRMSH